jgi:hypothetical protein
MLGLQQGAGYSGALLAFGANLYYIVLIRRQQATPHPVTWMVWTLIGALGAVSTVEAGAGPAALVPIAYAMVYAFTSYYAFLHFRAHRRDDENAITRYDLLLGAGAVLLAIAWKVADLLALAPTLRYTWTQPTTGAERQVWITDTLATALGLSAVSLPWTAAAIAYPGYLVAGNASVTAVMCLRSRQRLPSADPCVGQTTT